MPAGDAFPMAQAAADAKTLESVLVYSDTFTPGLPDVARGAHAVAFLAYQFASLAAALVLDTATCPDGRAPTAFRWNASSRPDERRILLGASLVSWHGPAQLAALLGAWLAPWIAELNRRTGLKADAQWLLAADSIAAAVLDVGRRLDKEAEACAIGRAVLADPDQPLFSPRTNYVLITAASGGDGRLYVERAGCCLAYRAPGSVLCDSCGLHPPRVRRARLTAHFDRLPKV